jgi:rod shape-determining protein MreC
MYQLFQFFSKNKIVLLFLLLELIAFVFIINSHSYHHSKYINSANALSGSILKKTNNIYHYFSLDKENKLLIKENEYLKNKIISLSKKDVSNLSIKIDSLSKYQLITARVISNPYKKRNNFLTIDKGSLDGIKPDMGVVLSNGIIGIIANVSNHYATVLSVLNSQSKINAKMLKSHHYGSLQWNGLDYSKIDFNDLPIQADVKIGDTIISGGKSVVFPEGIPIGTISNFSVKNKAYEFIKINLFTDFSALYNVYVIKNKEKEEQNQLEIKTINE